MRKNEKVEKVIIIMIILLVIFILILIGVFLFNSNRETESVVENNLDNITIEEIKIENNISDVENPVEFYTVTKNIDRYLNQLNMSNSMYYAQNQNGDYEIFLTQNEINQYVYDLLSKEYIEKNSINVNNLNQYIDFFDENILFTPINMRMLKNNNVTKYLVYGIIQNYNNEYLKDFYCFVTMDYADNTFSIEPLDDENIKFDEIEITNEGNSIEENQNNQFSNVVVDDKYITRELFLAYKRISLARPDIFYNFLDEEYRNLRFGNLESFEKYIDNNREELSKISYDKYQVNNYSDYKEYLCTDYYNNIYTFKVENLSNYSVLLDTYTVISENFKETYDSSNEEYKVAMNVDKWVQMLNNRDYKTAFSVLDETFRNNNWGSEEAFEQYMRENFPLHYEVEYTTYSNEGSTYVQQINLTDITGETEGTISLNIIMQLKDNYEFVMSFSVQE